MRAAVFAAPGRISVEEVPDPVVKEATDAIVRVTHAGICGSDLWFYRGHMPYEPGWRCGHEFLGHIAEVGAQVRYLRPGDLVLAPFAYCCGTCEFCREGLYVSCTRGGFWAQAHDGGQGEAVRVPYADTSLVKLPASLGSDEDVMRRLTTLTDVLYTGHHCARLAGVRPGMTVAVIGDGAVGLCAIAAAHRLRAERIIVLGHHPARLELARRFGATEVITARGDDAVAQLVEITHGGPPAVLEAVGSQSSLDQAVAAVRPGGTVGCVGMPHGDGRVDLSRLYNNNLTLRVGVANGRAYIPELLGDVIAGALDVSPIFDLTVDLAGVPDGYAAMSDRSALKVLVRQ